MPVSLFDKPIAAKPMSEFVALPLQFIDRTIQRRQAKYDKAQAEIDEIESDFVKSNALPGDAARAREIKDKYHAEIEAMAEAAGEDYSQIAAPMSRLSRRIKRDLSYGELGAQNRAYGSGA